MLDVVSHALGHKANRYGHEIPVIHRQPYPHCSRQYPNSCKLKPLHPLPPPGPLPSLPSFPPSPPLTPSRTGYFGVARNWSEAAVLMPCTLAPYQILLAGPKFHCRTASVAEFESIKSI